MCFWSKPLLFPLTLPRFVSHICLGAHKLSPFPVQLKQMMYFGPEINMFQLLSGGQCMESNWSWTELKNKQKAYVVNVPNPWHQLFYFIHLFLSVIIEVDKTTVFRVAFHEQGGNSGIMKLRGRKLLFWETCFVKAKEDRRREVRKINESVRSTSVWVVWKETLGC